MTEKKCWYRYYWDGNEIQIDLIQCGGPQPRKATWWSDVEPSALARTTDPESDDGFEHLGIVAHTADWGSWEADS